MEFDKTYSAAAFRYCLALCFVAATAAILFFVVAPALNPNIIIGDLDLILKPALIALGVSTITYIALRTERASVIAMTILIIGTVVAGDRFILSLTALLRNADKDQLALVTSYNKASSRSEAIRSGASQSAAFDPMAAAAAKQLREAEIETLVERLLEEAGDDPTRAAESISATLASRLVAEQSIAQLASSLGAEIAPLESLASGGSEWRVFVTDFQDLDFFHADMTTLRELDLITFEGRDYANAQITLTGREVLEFSGLGDPVATSLGFDEGLKLGPEFSELNIDTLPIIAFDATETEQLVIFDEFENRWFRLDLANSQRVRIATESLSKAIVDPTLMIRNQEVELAFNDDSEDLDALLDIELEAGAYFIRVQMLTGEFAETTLRISTP